MRLAHAAALAVILATSMSGCGSIAGDTSPGDQDAAADTRDKAPETGDAGSCVNASQGATCAAGDIACNQSPNPCCYGMWVCDATSHQWHQAQLGCACLPDDTGVDDAPPADAPDGAGSLVCGGMVCGTDQLCTARPPGIPVDASPPPLYYQCAAIPTACAGTPTCACVTAHPVPGCTVTGCSENAGGRLLVGCMGA